MTVVVTAHAYMFYGLHGFRRYFLFSRCFPFSESSGLLFSAEKCNAAEKGKSTAVKGDHSAFVNEESCWLKKYEIIGYLVAFCGQQVSAEKAQHGMTHAAITGSRYLAVSGFSVRPRR